MKPTLFSPFNADTLPKKVVSPDTRTLEKGDTMGIEAKTASLPSSRSEVDEEASFLSDAKSSASNSFLVQKFEESYESKTNINILSSEDRLAVYKQEVIQKILSVNLQPSLAIHEFQKIFADFLGKISSDLVVETSYPDSLNTNTKKDRTHTSNYSLEDFPTFTEGQSLVDPSHLAPNSHETQQSNKSNSIVPETPEKTLAKGAQSPNNGFIPETPVPKTPVPIKKIQVRKSSKKKLLSTLEEKKDSHSVTKSSREKNTTSPILVPHLDDACTSISKQKTPSKSICDEVREHLDGLYQPVPDGIVGILDEHKKFIFNLPSTFWPILPMGYKWFHVSKKTLPIVKKHSENKEKKFEITAFGPNDQKDLLKRINYITWFDRLNVQAYANTRPPKNTYQGTRKYPIKPEDYKTINNIPYDRGHCIDHTDTITRSGKSGKKELSSAHPKNFIPEPSFYNRNIRKTWVGQTRRNAKGHGLTARQSQGAYMQRVYYHPISLYDMSMPLSTTKNNTPIPTGIYFSEIDWQRNAIVRAADISWSYDFSTFKQKPTYLDDALPVFSINNQMMPTALVHQSSVNHTALNEIMHQYQQRIASIPLKEEKSSNFHITRCDRQVFEQIYQAAETEYLTISYKFEFSLWCAYVNLEGQAKIYLKRAEEHAKFLTKTGIPCRISKSQFSLFQKYSQKSKIFDDDKSDFWKKLVNK